MAQKTSINIKPCNIGSSEPHNRRTAEYLTRINKEKFYIRTDLMPKNEAWVAPDFRNTSLTERYNQIAVMVKEKTGRAMQTKDREQKDREGDHCPWQHSAQRGRGGNQGRYHNGTVKAFLRGVQGTLGYHTPASVHPP